MRKPIVGKSSEYDLDQIRRYRLLPARKKLIYLEEMNAFFAKITPPKAKRIWEQLQKKGW